MITLKNKKENTVVYCTEKYSVNGKSGLTIHVSKQNGKVVDYSIYSERLPFVCKKETTEEFRYYYFSPKIFDECKTKHFSEIDFPSFMIPFDGFKDDEIDLDRVLCPYYSGHMVFRIKDLLPVPTVWWFDYIGGIENEHYYIDKALAHLKKNKFVLEVEKKEIPFYNRNKNHTHGLEMKVLFSDEVFTKMWNCVKKYEFPTCRMKELVCCYYGSKRKIDPLGIKQFVKPEKVVKQEHKSEYRDDE